MNDKKSQRIGFLITHGTDTMSWGLSVLRYLIKNLPANIAITGSQIPISLRFAASDVYPNIENSIKLITQLTPSKIFVVFNNGRIAFQEAIWKIDKWDPEAFSGEKLALIAMDEIIIKGRSYPLNTERNLDILYLLRTGGTIESEENEVGILQPTANIVKDYIKNQLGNYFDQFKSISLMAKDSSDLVLDSWIAIGETIISKCHKYGYTTFLDKAFNNNVRIISTSPLKTEEEYKRLFKTTDGIILQGYGSGTINCDIDSGYSPLPAIREAITKGKVVIITSFTPLGTQDFVYQNAWKPLKEGAMPTGAFSVAHCQVKLAYILGHKKEIQETAQEANVHPEVLLKLAFLSGISFRSHKSRIKYEQLLGYPIPLTDPFQNVPFKTGLQQILQFIHRQKTKTIKINNLQDFKKIYQIYLSDENKRSNWVVILKPDLVIGVNKWGELIDAAKNMELLISEFLDWNVLTIELTTISYNELRALIKKLTNGKSIGSFLRTFRYIIVEGGRQSLYDPDSFESLSDSRFL